jgi:O-antigen/teichoic acid export membrane protein
MRALVWVRQRGARLSARVRQRPALANIVGNVAWLSADKVVRMGVGLVVGVWLARYLGPGSYGLFNFAGAFVGLFGALATMGLPAIVVRDLVQVPGRARETLGTVFVLHLLGALVACVVIVALISVVRPDDPLAKAAVAIMSLTLLARVGDIARYWFEAQVLSKYVVWVENGVYLVMAAVKVGLILAGAPLLVFIWAALVEVLVAAGVLLAVYVRKTGGLRGHAVRSTRMHQLLRDSWPLAMSTLAIAVYMRIDQIMLGQLVGDSAVGVYAAAVRVSEIWYFVPLAIVSSVFPSIIRARGVSQEFYDRRWQQLYDLMTLLAVGVALPMTFVSGWLIQLLFGAPYAAAGPVLAVHVWGSLFVFLGVASSQWFVIENRQLWSMHRTLAGAVTNVGLNVLLIPAFGVMGAASATVISYGVSAFAYDGLQRGTRGMLLMKIRSLNVVRGAARVRSS